MGIKSIWDGNDLPPVGSDVLIHLASIDKWVPHTVTGYDIKPHLEGDAAYHRIFINVESGKCINCRLLMDVRPLDWREGASQ
ncbi:hypothetical protein C9884_19025 [Klebsiella pneumoniae]|nr:hypothetical protein C9884_19025 [Klebsiella pneumoniae]